MHRGFITHAQIQQRRVRTSRGVRALSLAVSGLLVLLVIGSADPAGAAIVGSTRIDLRVLVLNDDANAGDDALVAEMDREGIPYDVKPTTTPITAATASTAGLLEGPTGEPPHAYYQAIVLPNDAPDGIDAAEMATLATYERTYGVRQVDSFLFPTANVGLVSQASGTIDGTTAALTPAALSGPFSYLKGPVTIDDFDQATPESFGYLAVPGALTAGQSWQPLLTDTLAGTTGSLLGVFTDSGREQLVVTGAFNASEQWFQVIAHGIVSWATRAVHLGYNRSYFSMHVDDIFLPDSRWSDAAKCTPGDDFCPTGTTTPDIRMTADDVARLVDFQNTNDLKLDMVFNGGGSDLWEQSQSPAATDDPLLDAFTAAGTVSQFRWINHTLTHPFLGCIEVPPAVQGDVWRCLTTADPATTPHQDEDLLGAAAPDGKVYLDTPSLTTQIQGNIDWANANGLKGFFDPAELVTGEHSGLRTLPQQPNDSPFLGPVLDTAGVAWTGSDASRETASRTVENSATKTVPRHPMNIFYNAGTYLDEVSEYNWVYTSAADGGSGICTANPATSTCITPLAAADEAQAKASFTSYIQPLEQRIALSHVLTNDPRPHYAHQSNLAEDGILYPVLQGMAQDYRATFAANTPIVQPTMTQAGEALQRSTAWQSAQSTATAYLDKDGVHVPDAGSVDVPVTVPTGSTGATLDAYAGDRSGWLSDATTLTVPDVGYHAAPVPDAPAAPTAVASTTVAGQVTVTWTAPTVPAGGDATTSYVVTPVKDGVAQPTIETGTTATTYDATGLAKGASYTFTVAARNGYGLGAASPDSAAVVATGLPDAPTGVTGRAGNGSVSLTWTAPSNTGGRPVTAYAISYTTGTSTTTLPSTADAAAEATVTGLTNGSDYTFQVAAVNSIGTGPLSAASATVTPKAAVPGAPTAVTGTAGDHKVDLSWTAPANDGGATVTSYLVTPYAGTTALPSVTTPSAATTFSVPGLTNGTVYTFTVSALNSSGTGAASDASDAVTPVGAPGAPTDLVATAGRGSVSLTWSAPTDTGGRPVTSYEVTYSPGGPSTPVTTTAGTASFTSLSNGVTYTFSVKAVNDAGTGAPATTTATPKAVLPGVPSGVVGTPGNGEVALTWTAPVDDGGAAVSSYVITPTAGGTPQTPIDTGSTSTTFVVPGLTNGTVYTFTVAARNGTGPGAASEASAPVTPGAVPGAPTAVTATGGNASASVRWTAPAGNGRAVTGYVVTPYAAGVAGSPISTGTTATSRVVTGLTNGVSYTFTVAATNAVGTGLPSAPSGAVVPATVPGAPTGVTATRGNARAVVTWAAPADNGSALTAYVVTPYVGNAARPAVTVGAGSTTTTVTGLTNGTAYQFTVTAVNGPGPGPASARSTAVTPIVGLTAVMRQPSSALTLRATVTYSWKLSPAGQPVSGYQVYVRRAPFGRPLPTAWTLLRTVRGTSTPITFAGGQSVVVAVKPIDPTGQAALLSAPTRPVTYPLGLAGRRVTGRWAKVYGAAFVHSPALQSTQRGAAVKVGRVVRATRFALVVTGGRRTGRVDVSVGGHRAWSVNLAACKGSGQCVLLSGTTRQRTGALVLSVRSSGKPVRLQGVAVLR
jgi:hypothetical protein